MYIAANCDGCGRCLPYCPVSAISLTEHGLCAINRDQCVECGVCFRSSDCPKACIMPTSDPWPRSVRGLFSNPLLEHKQTGIVGRGTEEMKTNDVTGRYKHGQVGLVLEVGRPGISTRLAAVQDVTALLACHGLRLEPKNPLASLIVDPEHGLLDPEVLSERVLSVVIECRLEEAVLPSLLEALEAFAGRLDTVFTVGLIRRNGPGREPVMAWPRTNRLRAAANGKMNLGLALSPEVLHDS